MPYKKRKQKCTQSDGDKGNYVLSYTTKKGEKRRACHTSEKNMQGQIAAIEAEADMSEEDMLEEIRALIREEVMRLGRSSVEVGPVKQDMDLMSVAKGMLEVDDFEGLEELVDFNNAVYTSIDKRDAWESIGEQLLTAWGFDAPAQGRKAAAAAGSDDTSVATFWDVRKDGVLYSVKTSFKTPTKPTNYRQATQSSNIKLTALLSAVKENPPSTMLGNIGCIYSEGENSRTVGWGNVTDPISAGDLKDKIRSLVADNVAAPLEDVDVLALYDQLTGSATGKKMSAAEAKSAKKIVAQLQNAGLVSSGARLTGRMTDFLGGYSEAPIASLKVYEPAYFFSETLAKMTSSKTGRETASDDARDNAIKRISTLARGMSSSQLDKLLSAARELMRESLIREYVSEATLLREDLTGSDKSEIKRMIRKELEGSTNRKEIDKAFKKNFDKELRKALGASFFGTPGKINKFVIDEIQKEVEKNMGSSANREVVVRICKDVLVKLYRELSFSYKPVIDRMKV